jgi:translation initiation factor 2 subunit 2
MSTEYQKLLDRALEKIPKKKGSGERFELPSPQITGTKTRTWIANFKEICDYISRDSHHVLKFLTRELATAATVEDSRAIFKGRFGRESIRRLLDIYIGRYVTCPICGRPDTKIVKEGRFLFLDCEACGARSSILAKQ